MEKDAEIYKYNPNHYCAIYARRSIKSNKENIENQLQTCRDKAHKLNLIISQEYYDYESATKYEPFHRPGFKQLIYDLKNNKFNSLIVFKRDRLARKTVHFKEIKYLCRQNNVKLIYAASDESYLDDDSEISSLIENILVSFAELEPANIRLRTKDGMDRKRASGNYSIQKKAPKGYIKIGKGKHAKLVHDTNLEPVITYLFKCFLKSPLTKNSLKSIVKDVNTKFNLNFTTSILQQIIKSPLYAGYYTRIGRTPIENLIICNEENNLSIDKSQLIPATNIKPIIQDYEVWENIVTKYFHVNGFSIINSLSSSPSMFSNLIYCKKCSSRVYLIDNYFKCVNHCFKIKKEVLLNKLLSEVIDDLFTYEGILDYYNNKMHKVHSQITTIEKQLKSINSSQDKLMLKMIKSKTTSNPTFDDLAIKKEKLKDEYDKLKEKMSEYIYYKENLHKKITFKEKNLLVQHFVLNEDMIFSEKQPASNTSTSPMVSDLTVVFKSRPELLKILTMASHKEFSHLIVYSSDRLARDVFQNALIKQHLEKNKVQLHFTKEGENFKNDPLSQKLQNILACFAEFEASTISSRVFDSLTQVFNRGDWPGGKAPLGFTLIDTPTGKTLNIDKTKIDIVKTAFQLFSSGCGYRKIADILSEKYFPYKFKKSTIEYMISNKAYFGILSWGKKGGRRKNKIKKNDYLTSDYKENLDIVGIANKNIIYLLKKLKADIKDPQYFSSPYILKDLLICSKCGKKLTPKNYGKNKTSVYRCPTQENSKSHNIIKANIIDELVLEKLSNINYCENDISKGYNKYLSSFHEKIKIHKDIILALNNKISKLKDNIVNIDEMLSEKPNQHVIDGLLKYKHHFEDNITLLLKQLEENKKQLNSAPISFEEFCNQLHTIIKQIPNKRMLCFLIIDKILVSNDNNQLKLNIIISPKTL